jgi:hypothetical protein
MSSMEGRPLDIKKKKEKKKEKKTITKEKKKSNERTKCKGRKADGYFKRLDEGLDLKFHESPRPPKSLLSPMVFCVCRRIRDDDAGNARDARGTVRAREQPRLGVRHGCAPRAQDVHQRHRQAARRG